METLSAASVLIAGPSQARVIMLTAAGTVDDKVAGLTLGADDYLGVKPFASSP